MLDAGTLSAFAGVGMFLIGAGGLIGRKTGAAYKERQREKQLHIATMQAVWGSPPVLIDGREIHPKQKGLVEIVQQQTQIIETLAQAVGRLEEHTHNEENPRQS